MAGRGVVGSVMNAIMKGLLILVALGFLLFLLKLFGMDVFALLTWIYNWAVTIIVAISDWFATIIGTHLSP